MQTLAATLLTLEVLDEDLWAGMDWAGEESVDFTLFLKKSSTEEKNDWI